MTLRKKTIFPLITFILSFFSLSVIQIKVKNPMILLERFYPNLGWFEIFILSLFGAFLVYKMIDKKNIAYWRKTSWLIFGIIFFIQLILGLLGFDKFLMSGELHLPIPAIIIGGAIFKLKFSFMPILLLSTIILSGPAWCSQLCYFGAFDNLAAFNNKQSRFNVKNLFAYKHIILLLFIIGTVLLRFLNVNITIATIWGGVFGIVGLIVLLVFSTRKGKMIHCIAYCPIGTIVSYLKFINPFRMYIDTNCTNCMKCTSHCNYLALEKENIENKKPGLTCTYCGDCLQSCHTNSIKYKLFGVKNTPSKKVALINPHWG